MWVEFMGRARIWPTPLAIQLFSRLIFGKYCMESEIESDIRELTEALTDLMTKNVIELREPRTKLSIDRGQLEQIARYGGSFTGIMDGTRGLELYFSAKFLRLFLDADNEGFYPASLQLRQKTRKLLRQLPQHLKSVEAEIRETADEALFQSELLAITPSILRHMVREVCDQFIQVAKLAYPKDDIEELTKRRYNIQMATRSLTNRFRVQSQQRGSQLRLTFFPASEAKVWADIQEECNVLNDGNRFVTRSWLLSVWDRTRLLDSPSSKWFQGWQKLISSLLTDGCSTNQQERRVCSDPRAAEKLKAHLKVLQLCSRG